MKRIVYTFVFKDNQGPLSVRNITHFLAFEEVIEKLWVKCLVTGVTIRWSFSSNDHWSGLTSLEKVNDE